MSLGRRDFLIGTGALTALMRPTLAALQHAPRPGGLFPPTIRRRLPRRVGRDLSQCRGDSPARHVRRARPSNRRMAYRMRGAGPGRADFGAEKQNDLKTRFGKLIGAKPTEIAFTSSTSDGENIVVLGLDLPKRRATSSSTSCTSRRRSTCSRSSRRKASSSASSSIATGRSTSRTWIARSTRTRGWCRWRWSPTSTATCTTARRSAHSRTRAARYVFADIIQAVGAVPVDVRALGIDFAATGTYKWLMGERGFGFLYVREDLQGTVLPTTRYGHRQVANFNRAALTWEPLPGAAMYETGNIAVLLAACVSAGIDYVQRARRRQDSRARPAADRSAAERAAAARLHSR